MKFSFVSQGLLPATLALLFSGCSTVDTTTYFAAANIDAKDPSVSLYRVRVHAESVNSNPSLLTGFYDTAALRSLYGEVGKPSDPPGTGSTKALGTYNVVYREGRWQLVDPAQLYTVVYGPDSKSIAQLIKSYAESTSMGAQFGALLAAASNPEAPKIAGDIENQELALTQKKKALGSELSSLASAIDPTKAGTETPDEILQNLTAAAQAIANSMGAVVTFHRTAGDDPMAEIRTFLTTERSRTP